MLLEEAGHAAEQAEHTPVLVQFVNQYFGQWAYDLEMKTTYPFWTKVLGKFGTTPEALFGVYTPENAIPWYTVMFFIACVLSVVIIWILKGRVSSEEPGHGQQTLEVSVLPFTITFGTAGGVPTVTVNVAVFEHPEASVPFTV